MLTRSSRDPRDVKRRPSGHDQETRRELSIMATETGSATVSSPADVGLKREMGFIGAVWASESSIIGSGWLFGALYAAQAAGPAAIIAWVIGGVTVVVLGPLHP